MWVAECNGARWYCSKKTHRVGTSIFCEHGQAQAEEYARALNIIDHSIGSYIPSEMMI